MCRASNSNTKPSANNQAAKPTAHRHELGSTKAPTICNSEKVQFFYKLHASCPERQGLQSETKEAPGL
jgi:hypothetical protein